jgi:hypothetical protein
VLLERALDAGVPAAWVTADEVYGQDPTLRGWLEGRQMAHVLAIKSSELLAVSDGPAKLSAAQLAAAVPAEHWVGASASQGAKGRRLYDWTRIQLARPAAPGMARWLLVRRSRRDGELAFYAGYGPVDTSLLGLVRVAGESMGDRGRLPAGQERSRPGPRRGPQMAWLVPAHHPGSAGPCLPGRHPHQGHQRQPRKGGRGA